MELLNAAGIAFGALIEPHRMLYLTAGVVMGLFLGIVPGLGGLIGLTILLPFTYSLDPYSAMALLMGLHAVTHTSDTIPAVLFGVPGTVGCAATVLDGYPLAKRGEAGRALGASFTASMLGGLFGALLLTLCLPVIRPIVLSVGTPQLLAICIFGMSLVAVLSGASPSKGMAAAALGLLLSFVGMDSQAGELRWTFGSIYLWEGIPIVAVALGLFAIPELSELALRPPAEANNAAIPKLGSQWEGVRDAFRHWWLVIRCSWIGAALGAAPGIPTSVIDWVAYGHAQRTEKNAAATFGTGDIRGVIASESSNNAKEGGDLVTTIAFGIPGGAAMVLIMSALLMQGIVPGPDMLSTKADVTFLLVWSVVFANILGAGFCLLFSGQLAKVLSVRPSVLVPVIIAVVFLGAYQAERSWGDLIGVVVFGVVGLAMKYNNWPRAPLLLGFVMGDLIERYMFISVERYGWSWLLDPIVLGFFALTLFGLVRAMSKTRPVLVSELPLARAESEGEGANSSRQDLLFTLLLVALFAAALVSSAAWPIDARLAPTIGAGAGLLFSTFAMVGALRRFRNTKSQSRDQNSLGEAPPISLLKYVLSIFFVLVGCGLFGLIGALFVFIVGYMHFLGKERLGRSAMVASGAVAVFWIVFDRLLITPWPQSLLGNTVPILRYATGLV